MHAASVLGLCAIVAVGLVAVRDLISNNRRRPILVVVAVTLVLPACGGGDEGGNRSGGSGLNRSNPVAVAKAFAESRYRCGDQGAGVRAELTYPPAKAEDHRREAAEEKLPGGCEEEAIPQILAVQVPGQGEFPTLVEVSNPVDCEDPEPIPLIQIEGRWYVDERKFNPRHMCFRYGRG